VTPQPAGDGGVMDAYAVRKQPALQFGGGATLAAQGEQLALVSVKAGAAVSGTAAGAGLGPQSVSLGGGVEGFFGGRFVGHRITVYTLATETAIAAR